MIERLRIRNFKRFSDQSFDLRDRTVLVGPNNSGKTTLLQAISIWKLALEKWSAAGPGNAGKAKVGVPVSRLEFLALPIRDLGLLWTDSSTALSKGEGRPGASRVLAITVGGRPAGQGDPWELTMEFRYANPELMYVRASPAEQAGSILESVLYIPSSAGIGMDESIQTAEHQAWLVGQGKPGDIIRNLLVDIHGLPGQWESLVSDIRELFGCDLLPPAHFALPHIRSDYRPRAPVRENSKKVATLDIANSGSGFAQALLLLSFLRSRPASVILLDEPDAHLHVNLQEEIYRRVVDLAGRAGSQLVVATHSEVLVNRTDFPDIISFYGEPRPLGSTAERERVREALKRVSNMDMLGAESGKVLYVEGMSDYYFLRSWARILGHPVGDFLSDAQSAFVVPMGGMRPKDARAHFFALQGGWPEIVGFGVVDKNNKRDAPQSSDGNLKFGMWGRYEIENYLVHQDVIGRFAERAAAAGFPLSVDSVTEDFRNSVTRDVLSDPFGMSSIAKYVPASTGLLPRLFDEAGIRKSEYYKIAEVMKPEEIHPDVKRMLDRMWEHFGQRGS